MANISIKDINPISQTIVTGRRSPEVVVEGIRPRYKIDKETKQKTNELEGYTLDIVARNKTQSVKLPVLTREIIDEIREALQDNKIVKVSFNGTFRGKAYALLSENRLIEGISCTASEVTISSIEDIEFDDINDVIL